jgi:enoyl-CoA hydratase
VDASTDPGDFVRYDVSDGVGVITLDRPPLNTYDDALHLELEHAWRRAALDGDARVVVLRAMGKHFCAGAEMKEPRALEPGQSAGAMTPPEELAFIRNLMKPTIAAVQGGCIGGGQRFVFPCDLIFCSEDAFFRDPLVSMGIGGIQSPLHAWFYGPRLAKEMLFGGTRVPAERLYAMGTVNRLYPRELLHDETLAFAREVAAADPVALRQAKRSVNITTDIMGQHYITSRFAELLDESPRLTM